MPRLSRYSSPCQQQFVASSKKTTQRYTAVVQAKDRCKPAKPYANSSSSPRRLHLAPSSLQILHYQFSRPSIPRSSGVPVASDALLIFYINNVTMQRSVPPRTAPLPQKALSVEAAELSQRTFGAKSHGSTRTEEYPLESEERFSVLSELHIPHELFLKLVPQRPLSSTLRRTLPQPSS